MPRKSSPVAENAIAQGLGRADPTPQWESPTDTSGVQDL